MNVKLKKEFQDAYNKFVASAELKTVLEKMEVDKKAGEEEKNNGSMLIDITSERKDRHGEYVLQDGLNFSDWSGVVVGDHDYRLEKFVGKGVAKKIDGGITEMSVEFAPTPYAQFVRELKEANMPLMASIGFIPTMFDEEDRSIIKEAEVIEVSIVVVGSNRDANIKMTDEMALKCKEFGIEIKSEDEVEDKNLTKKTSDRLDAIEKKLDARLDGVEKMLKILVLKKEIDDEIDEDEEKKKKKEEEDEIETEEEAKKSISDAVKGLQELNKDFSKGLFFLKKVRNEEDKKED